MTVLLVPVEFVLNVPDDFDFEHLYLLFDYSYSENEIESEFGIKAIVETHETQEPFEIEGESDSQGTTLLVPVEFILNVPDDFDYDDLFLDFDYDHVALEIKRLFGIKAVFETHETGCPYELPGFYENEVPFSSFDKSSPNP